jgi:hypothetical protein
MENINDKYQQIASIIATAGPTPLPVTETLISILKGVIPPDDLDFIAAFRDKRS